MEMLVVGPKAIAVLCSMYRSELMLPAFRYRSRPASHPSRCYPLYLRPELKKTAVGPVSVCP